MLIESARGQLKLGNRSGVLDNSLFHTHFENLPSAAFIWQRAGRDFELIAYNRTAAETPVGHVAPLLGNLASTVFTKHPTCIPDLEQCDDTGAVVIREVDFLYPSSGAVRRLVMTFVPVVSGTVVLHTEDITKRDLAEKNLAASERKYRKIVDTTSEGVSMIDAQAKVTFVNRQMAAMVGCTPDEMTGRPIFDFVDDADRPQVEAGLERRRAGVTEQHDFRFRRKDGSYLWTRISATPLTDNAGNYAGSLGMISDISARREAEQALKESESRLRAMLDSNPDVIFRMDQDGNFLDFHAAKSLGFPFQREELLGHNIAEFFGEEAREEHRRYARDALRSGTLQVCEFKVTVDARDLYLESRFVRSGDGEVVVNVRDITERVTLERELTVISERERNRIGRDIHDGLAQNLAGAKMLLEHLTRRLKEDGSPYSDEAARGVALLDTTIREARELARGLSPVPQGTSLFGALAELATHSETIFGISCPVTFAGAVGSIDEAAKVHLYRIAQEAITNAAKHGKAARVDLCCAVSNERLELSIVDNGSGVVETENEGLGLRIMRHRAKSIGGRVALERLTGGGTRVTFSCPLTALFSPSQQTP